MSTEKLLVGLNSEQTEAVKHTTGPLLIVAGAGTGKTTVITRKIAYLIEQGLAKPEEILALTFTDKAAGEMQERVDLLLPLGYYDMWISTFHSFCERILKSHGLDIGLPNNFQLLNEVQQWILVHRNFDKFDLNYYRPLGNPNKFIDALISHFSRCKDELISPSDYLKYAQELRLETDEPVKGKKTRREDVDETEITRIEELANAFHVYQKLLRDNGFLDFGDLINCTVELFQKRPKVLKCYQDKFKFIMVDEFQDTNYAQYQLVKMLAGERGNLVVVGDDDQSIYKFRGASVSNILKFKENFQESKQIALVGNYRSRQEILDLAYNFIQANNPDRLEIKLDINKKLKSGSDEKAGEVRVLEGQDLSEELDCVAKKILELKNNGTVQSWNDFAVLIRANNQADELLPVLDSYNIPYTYFANRGLYKKPIVLDVLSYMRVLDNTHDSSSLYRVLTLPPFRLTHHELSTLLQYSSQKTLTLYETLLAAQTFAELSEEARKKLGQLLAFLSKHSQMLKSSTATEIMVETVAVLGLEEKLKEDSQNGNESRELLDQFYKRVEEFEKQSEQRSLHDFLQALNLEMQAGNDGGIKFDPNLGPESVKVLTVHSAKGLEFKCVFVINMVDQRFPSRKQPDPIEIPKQLIKEILPEGDFHLQEERRLFYVALTRAKTHLYLTWAKDYGGARAKKPSQFLVETGLVPSEKVSKATGKVVFTKTNGNGDRKEKTQVYHKLPSAFSYTQLTDFESCPLKYKYVHFLKLPWPGSHHMSFGSTIHKTFEEFLKIYKNNQDLKQMDLFGQTPAQNPLPEFKLLEQFYQKYWIDDWYPSKKEKEGYRKLGWKMLETFHANLSEQQPTPKYIEKFFKLKLQDFEFRGKIDRADQTKQGLEIIDYKTGKTPKNKKDVDQLKIYQWAAQEFLKEKVGSLKYWYLQDNEFVEQSLSSPEEIVTLQEELLEIMKKIVNTVKFDLFKEEHAKLKDHNCPFEHLE